MILGLVLILIVVVPYGIYLYIINKYLTKRVKELELENKEILIRKINSNSNQDKIPLTTITTQQPQTKKEHQNTFADNNFSKNFQQDVTKIKNQDDYLKEVMKNLNEKLTKKPIDLTEYEQEQENNAVISYQELKKEEKKQGFIVKEEDNTTDFLNNLKQFRNNLK